MILAPLRGVTIRCFREVFAEVIAAAGFTEAVTPFIAALPGLDPLKDRELAGGRELAMSARGGILLTPQFIGKDPAALRLALARVRDAGYATADLNCGCPFPMVRNKGRGSGILRTPDILERMLEVGCETMGAGVFSVKTRLGVERPDELAALMPIFNRYPLRYLTVHARTARQMYAGEVDRGGFAAIKALAKMPVVENGELPFPPAADASAADRSLMMIGRPFIRALGDREDIGALLDAYIEASRRELCGDRPVLGRMKELLAYWKDLPRWRRRWTLVKMSASIAEIKSLILCN